MRRMNDRLVNEWRRIGMRFLPFADAATTELPLGRLLRLSLFQVSVGMALVLLNGTLNRVMIVELDVPTWLVALMVSLPLLVAPFRAFIGFRSDTHKSFLGWKRVPYIWMGTLLQFGGLAIMPFSLFILSGDTHGPVAIGYASAALAFLMVGAGMHVTQTAGLALATDLAPREARPRVVALLYVMLLVGMFGSSLVFGALLADFAQVKLIQVVQGAAVVTVMLNILALWKQEARNPAATAHDIAHPTFSECWRVFAETGRSKRLLVAVGLGTAAFSMQDILLEPYGGQIFSMSVSTTTLLTAILAFGTLAAFALTARLLTRGTDPLRLAAAGVTVGVAAFSALIFAAPFGSPLLLQIGTALIGFGGGMFAIGMLTAAMDLADKTQVGLTLGAWGAVQASAAGAGIALGGAIRDVVTSLAENGKLGPALTDPAVGYAAVYHIEIALLFVTLIVVGPLVRRSAQRRFAPSSRFGLTQFPG